MRIISTSICFATNLISETSLGSPYSILVLSLDRSLLLRRRHRTIHLTVILAKLPELAALEARIEPPSIRPQRYKSSYLLRATPCVLTTLLLSTDPASKPLAVIKVKRVGTCAYSACREETLSLPQHETTGWNRNRQALLPFDLLHSSSIFLNSRP
jgi:hypothetical protein